MKLTDLTVRNLPTPDQGQSTYYDDQLKGFGVRVSQGGTKSFVFVHGTNRKRITIGRYPLISLAEARKEAKRILADATLYNYLPEAITFQEARNRYLEHIEHRLRPPTVSSYQHVLERKFASLKGRLAEITVQQVMTELHKIQDTPRMQGNAFAVIRAFFNWCVQNQYLRVSPLAGMPSISRQVSRERVLDDHELKAVYTTAKQYPFPFGSIVQLLILTGQRRGEISKLEWDWIDETITFPREVTKNHRTHVLPITDTVRAVLEDIPHTSQYVFPASRVMNAKTTVFNGFSKTKAHFDKQVYIDHWTLHDLRRTFASNLARLNTPIHVTEKILNHTSGTFSGVVAIYNRHSYIDEMLQAMRTFEDHLAELCKS